MSGTDFRRFSPRLCIFPFTRHCPSPPYVHRGQHVLPITPHPTSRHSSLLPRVISHTDAYFYSSHFQPQGAGGGLDPSPLHSVSPHIAPVTPQHIVAVLFFPSTCCHFQFLLHTIQTFTTHPLPTLSFMGFISLPFVILTSSTSRFLRQVKVRGRAGWERASRLRYVEISEAAGRSGDGSGEAHVIPMRHLSLELFITFLSLPFRLAQTRC